MKKTTLIAALLLVALGPAFLAAEAKFVLLGEKEVNFLVDRDDLVVGLKDGMFRRLRFEVEKNDLEMLQITVTFGNGKTAIRGGFGMFYNRLNLDTMLNPFSTQLVIPQIESG